MVLAAVFRLLPRPAAELQARLDEIRAWTIERLEDGRRDGVAVLAEGLALTVDPAQLPGVEETGRDSYGNVRVADIRLAQPPVMGTDRGAAEPAAAAPRLRLPHALPDRAEKVSGNRTSFTVPREAIFSSSPNPVMPTSRISSSGARAGIIG